MKLLYSGLRTARFLGALWMVSWPQRSLWRCRLSRARPSVGDLVCRFWGGRLGPRGALALKGALGRGGAGVGGLVRRRRAIAIDAPPLARPSPGAFGRGFTRSMLVMMLGDLQGARYPARIRSEHHPVPSPGSATSSLCIVLIPFYVMVMTS
jgi:hypothetical protein